MIFACSMRRADASITDSHNRVKLLCDGLLTFHDFSEIWDQEGDSSILASICEMVYFFKEININHDIFLYTFFNLQILRLLCHTYAS